MIFAMTCYGIAKAIQCIYILDYLSLKCGRVYSHSLKLSTMTGSFFFCWLQLTHN